MREEEILALAMAQIQGLGRRSLNKLLDYTGSVMTFAELPYHEMEKKIGKKCAKNFADIYGDTPDEKKENLLKVGERCAKDLEKKGISFVSCLSEKYPKRLSYIPDKPFLLYYSGRLPDDKKPTVAIIGARACSEYGKMVAYKFGRELAIDGVQIVSGMARGIDGVGQKGALSVHGQTYAVLGSGVDVCYPKEHIGLYEEIKNNGGLISEYPPGTKPLTGFFPERNRIISGLADIVLVVEAKTRSGTYITVTQALEQGREVYAVPGRITDVLSDGCNRLIKDGAGVADGVNTLLDVLKQMYPVWNVQVAPGAIYKTELLEPEENVRKLLRSKIRTVLDSTPVNISEIGKKIAAKGIDVSIQNLMKELLYMEMEGSVEGEGCYYWLKFK